MRNAIKNHQVVDTNMFNGKDNNTNNREEKDDEELKDNIDVPIIDLYSYTIAITHISCQK